MPLQHKQLLSCLLHWFLVFLQFCPDNSFILVSSLMFLRIYFYISYPVFLVFSERGMQIATHHYQKLEPDLFQFSHFVDKESLGPELELFKIIQIHSTLQHLG